MDKLCLIARGEKFVYSWDKEDKEAEIKLCEIQS